MSAANFETAHRALLTLEQDFRSSSVRWDEVAQRMDLVGTYLMYERPNKIDEQFVSKIEYSLDQVLQQLQQQFITPALQDAVMRSLKTAAAINTSLASQWLTPEYFSNLKILGQGLLQTAEILGAKRNLAGDPTTPPPPPEKKKKKKGQEK